MIPKIEETSNGKINEITLGQKTIGGEDKLPILGFHKNKPPLLGLEIQDIKPDIPKNLEEPFKDVIKDPIKWAEFCQKQDIDLLSIRFEGTNPEGDKKTDEQATEILKQIQEKTTLPLLIYGSGNKERDAMLFNKLGTILKKDSIIGNAEEENYKSIAANAIANDLFIIAFSPIDVNIAKQVNILLTEFGVKPEKILIDPLASGLGYGLEYSYSIIERLKIAALAGDKMLSMPIICNLTDVWNAKESNDTENLSWGDVNKRGVLWETLTAISLITAGADIIIMRHPEALKKVKEFIKSYFS